MGIDIIPSLDKNIYGYLYKTTNKINGKFYIGQRRGQFTKNYFGSGHGIIRAIKKYGVNNFKVEIICQLPTRNQLDEFEKFMIAKYREIIGRKRIYNMSNGGTGGDNIKYNSNPQEIYKRISDKLKGRPGKSKYWLGKKHSEESNKKRSEKLRGRIFSEECRKLRGQLQRGNNRSAGKGKRQQGLLMAIYI